MKINTCLLTCIICMLFPARGMWAQTNQETADPDLQEYILYSYNLTLEDVLHLAATQSNEALRARNSFR